MIVLIGGRAGEGKSTFANLCGRYLIQEKSISSVTIPFASMVKETAFVMGWDGEKDDKGRKLLQEVGRIGREYDLNLWANHVVNYIKDCDGQGFEYYFIDDWRFPNEAKVIREHFHPVELVRMRRPEEFHTLIDTALYNDVSEASLSDENSYYDYIVNNSKDLDELEAQAEQFVEEILERRL
jgi:dephospho-CoA kinase